MLTHYHGFSAQCLINAVIVHVPISKIHMYDYATYRELTAKAQLNHSPVILQNLEC